MGRSTEAVIGHGSLPGSTRNFMDTRRAGQSSRPWTRYTPNRIVLGSRSGSDSIRGDRDILWEGQLIVPWLGNHPTTVTVEPGSIYENPSHRGQDSLFERVKREGPRHYTELFSLFRSTARALDLVHAEDIIYDITPSNIRWNDKLPRIEGRRKVFTEKTDTLYMSPEERSGIEGTSNDKWKLAATLYFVTTGEHLMAGLSEGERQKTLRDPIRLREFVHDRLAYALLPASVQEVFAYQLSSHPDNRYPTNEMFLAALDGAVAMDEIRPPDPQTHRSKVYTFGHRDGFISSILPEEKERRDGSKGGNKGVKRFVSAVINMDSDKKIFSYRNPKLLTRRARRHANKRRTERIPEQRRKKREETAIYTPPLYTVELDIKDGRGARIHEQNKGAGKRRDAGTKLISQFRRAI
jgi:hypothetical protein